MVLKGLWLYNRWNFLRGCPTLVTKCSTLKGNFKERERTKVSLLVPKIGCYGVKGEN